ncbi:MAG: hypothetical protein HYY84_20220 [Deltaproteobacteria bacterium]|nr:hypothetical protein [Deltaproteobacteria bacterium]
MFHRVVTGISLLGLFAACGKADNGASGAPGGDPNGGGGTPPPPPSTSACSEPPKALTFIREGRRSTPVDGKGELVVVPDTAAMSTFVSVTEGTDFCNYQVCLLTPDRSRLIYVKNNGAADQLFSAPVQNDKVDATASAQVLLSAKLTKAAEVVLDPPARRVYFYEENAQSPLAVDLKSAPVEGGAVTVVRAGLGLGAVFNVAKDGATIAIGDVNSLGRCSTVMIASADGRNAIPLRIVRSKEEGNPKAQIEKLALTPQGDAIYVFINIDNVNHMLLVKTDGSDFAGGQRDCEDVQTQPSAIPSRIIGRLPCPIKVSTDNICRIHSELFVSRDGNTVYFLGGNDYPNQHAQFAEIFSMPRGLTGVTRLTESEGPYGGGRNVEWPMEDVDLSPDRCNLIYSSDIPYTLTYNGREVAPRTTDDREVWTRPLTGDVRTPLMLTNDYQWIARHPRYLVQP